MTHDQCYVYILDDSFDVRDTHTLDFIRKYHYELCSLTQTVHPPEGKTEHLYAKSSTNLGVKFSPRTKYSQISQYQ